MINFKEITLEDISVIKNYLKYNDNQSCEFSVANIYMWNLDNKLKYAIVNEQIVFRSLDGNHSIYAISAMNNDLEEIVFSLMEDAKEQEKIFRMSCVSEKMKERLMVTVPNIFEYKFNRDYSDYLYNTQDLIELKGKKFHGKKNHINQFLKNYEYVYEDITVENIADCSAMKESWKMQNDSMDLSFELELKAVDIALNHYQDLGLVGGLIRIDGEVKAFTIGERLTQNTFVTHIEKADHNIRGLYPMINQQFAINQLVKYEYVNREEDLGIEGLRKAKLSYQPAIILNKYEVSLL